MSTLETTPTTRDAVQAFIAGWNAHSPKAVRDAFTADGRLCDPVVPSWTSGEAIEAAVQRALDRYTDVAFTVRSVLEAPDARVVFEWRMTMAVVTSDGRRIPIDGIGLRAAETAARFPSLGGRIRYQEMAAGRIDHALFAASSQIAYTWVYPAEKSDGGDNPRQDYPPMGERFQLDPSYMTDQRLATYPPWKRAVLKAIRDYGFFLGDSTSKSLAVIPIESGTSYTSFGLPDPWVRYAKTNGLPPSYDSQIHRTVYTFDLASGVDWSKLRAIDPCVTSKDC